MKKLLLLFLTIFAVLSLSGCEDYYPSNAPRQTVTNKAAVLTTVTSIETSRPETYSEYISSLHEMESSIREEASQTVSAMERVTAVSKEAQGQRETAVTTVPKTEPEESEQTVTCASNTESSVTSPIFDLSDIPAVPSDRVRADTALTNAP